MTALEPWLARLAELSAVSIGIAVAVVLAVLLFATSAPAPQRLEQRARRLTDATAARGPREGGEQPNLLQRIATNPTLVKLRRQVVDWVYEHSPGRRQAQTNLRQAGIINPRAPVYFEAARVAGALVVGFLFYQLMVSTGLTARGIIVTVVGTGFGVMLGLYLPELWVKRRVKARRAAFGAAWDDAIGLLIICLDAGLSIEVALRRIARELAPSAPVLAEELIITVTDLSLLRERRLAYLNLANRMDLPAVKAVTVTLIQAERQGASIANSLRVISTTIREERVSRAEEKAAKLGPKMTVPMIVFFLPVIFVIIIAPIVMTSDFF